MWLVWFWLSFFYSGNPIWKSLLHVCSMVIIKNGGCCSCWMKKIKGSGQKLCEVIRSILRIRTATFMSCSSGWTMTWRDLKTAPRNRSCWEKFELSRKRSKRPAEHSGKRSRGEREFCRGETWVVMWMRLSRSGIKLRTSPLCIFGAAKFELWKVVSHAFSLLSIAVVEKVLPLRNGLLIHGGATWGIHS